MSANVGSLGSSAPGELGLAGVGTANAADVDATPLRARIMGDRTHATPHNLTKPPGLYRFLQPVTMTDNTGRIGNSNHI
jgi:hypothetical protein